ncbi:hypothetical protein OS493_013364 [Desmophyllum pertusum]|uniref:Uncharacterized protein n=1 Tax=Desmophyllum pertusum TaxID=174260 RepID=A0A9W9YDI0_9CNID|nr:hypothetical protein OS493_013364 [Desmophyllum pertusum]
MFAQLNFLSISCRLLSCTYWAHVEAGPKLRCLSWSFNSILCSGSNLIKIHIDRCNNSTGKKQCEVTTSGTNTANRNTNLKIAPITTKTGKRKCIQFTDNNGTKYALKVVNDSNIIFEAQPLGCHNAIGGDFMFEEAKNNGIFIYKHSTKCLTSDCNGKLYLISSINVYGERKCFFSKLKPPGS